MKRCRVVGQHAWAHDDPLRIAEAQQPGWCGPRTGLVERWAQRAVWAIDGHRLRGYVETARKTVRCRADQLWAAFGGGR